VLLRAVKVGLENAPPGIAGLAFLWGYFNASLQRVAQVEDPEFRRFVRRELRARIGTSLRSVAAGRAP
jgi:hypothetical protein